MPVEEEFVLCEDVDTEYLAQCLVHAIGIIRGNQLLEDEMQPSLTGLTEMLKDF